MQETIEFLSEINIIPVDEQSGQKLGLGIGGTIAGRTNTAGGTRRAGIDPTAMDGSDYVCKQTNFDTALRYDKLDMWAKFPDFETRSATPSSPVRHSTGSRSASTAPRLPTRPTVQPIRCFRT
jgi:hypothetical protein